jgi:L-ascorbate metabolism protein UlaG (beta-lactamase superfamily)
MKIHKYAHACLLVEKDGVKVVIDPGSWNETPDATGVSAILITHEHGDHCDLDQVRSIVAANPGVRVISHAAVGEKLAEIGIEHEVIEPGVVVDVKGLTIESFGTEHAAIYKASPCRNTGFLIGGELFIPGDALHDVPNKPVRVLALPTGGPWMKLEEAIDYAKAVKPSVIFPYHDAMHTDDYRPFVIGTIGRFLEGTDITPIDLAAGETKEF